MLKDLESDVSGYGSSKQMCLLGEEKKGVRCSLALYMSFYAEDVPVASLYLGHLLEVAHFAGISSFLT